MGYWIWGMGVQGISQLGGLIVHASRGICWMSYVVRYAQSAYHAFKATRYCFPSSAERFPGISIFCTQHPS